MAAWYRDGVRRRAALHGRAPTAINRFVIRRLAPATASKNEAGEHVGLLNRPIARGYPLHLAGRRLKRRNRLYYALKYGVIASVVALLLHTVR